MDDIYHWRVEATKGEVFKAVLWPLFSKSEIEDLRVTLIDSAKVYVEDVITQCYKKGLILVSTNGTEAKTFYHFVRIPNTLHPTIITDTKET